jgi:hypothetical protein
VRCDGSNHPFQFPGETGAARVGQIHEAQRLQAALRCPHGKHHARAATDAGASDVKQDRHLNAFIEWMIERDETAVDRELAHAAVDLASVFEQHQGKHGTAEPDARGPLFLVLGGRGNHPRSSLLQAEAAGQVTKVDF